MKDADYNKLAIFSPSGDVLCPVNERACDLVENAGSGTELIFLPVNPRDIHLHKMYFGLLNYVWGLMTPKFKEVIPKAEMYKVLKHLQRHYKIIYRFKDDELRQHMRDFFKKNRKSKKNPRGQRFTYKFVEQFVNEFGFTSMVEYTSISFSKMDNESFKTYVREQLPFLYQLIHDVFNSAGRPELADMVIANVEQEFEKSFVRYKL